MRKIALWTVLLVVSVVMPLAAQTKVSPVVMTVNDQPVYSWEIGFLIPQIQSEMAGRGVRPTREDVVKTAVQRAVDSRLLAQEAQRRNLKPDSARVDAAISQIVEQAGGREGLNTALGGLGATYEQLAANVAEADLVQVFVATQIEPQVVVKPDDVVDFYNQNPEMFDRPDMVRARHILIRITPATTPEEKESARGRATAAHKRVVAGEDFATVAIEVSDGPNASTGGDMGFFPQDSMVPALANGAFALDVGQISDVIETQFGFHIVKVEEKRAASRMSFEDAKGPVTQLIRENRIGEGLSEVLAKLKETANVVPKSPPGGAPAG